MSQRYKLLSPKKTLVGTVTFPDHWEDALWSDYRKHGRGVFRFHATTVEERRRRRTYDPDGGRAADTYSVGAITMFHSFDFGEECVQLLDVDLKTFEQLPGCTITLGVAYMETLLRGV